ncbi:hypothetical protein ACTNDP_11925 [Paenibacillus barengoltzii]|uniref:hypothetical protein n=1 Tax=Paenibacillus barengoltzii TaxID=343517 RepID=UPI003F8A2473
MATSPTPDAAHTVLQDGPLLIFGGIMILHSHYKPFSPVLGFSSTSGPNKTETTFGNIKADVCAAMIPDFKRTNFCDCIHHSPWNE